MEGFRDNEIERLVRELSEAWASDAVDGAKQVSIQSRPMNVPRPRGEDEVGLFPVRRAEGRPILSLVPVSGRSQDFGGGRGAGDSLLGRELARRTR